MRFLACSLVQHLFGSLTLIFSHQYQEATVEAEEVEYEEEEQVAGQHIHYDESQSSVLPSVSTLG